MAEEIERYRAKFNFRHKFEDVKQQLDPDFQISSPEFFVRNIPFHLELWERNGQVTCALVCLHVDSQHYSLNVEYQLSLITPSKTIQSKKYSSIFHEEYYIEGHFLSEAFPGEEIFVDGAITIEVSIWMDEPQEIDEKQYKPPKKKLRQELQVVENQVKSDAFASLLDSGDFSDVTFILNADSSKVKAHKNILASRSEVFARMFRTEMAEAKDNEIRIVDMGAPALKIMFHHIYSGQLDFPKGIKIDMEICMELVNAGEKYNLQNLKEYAAMAMTEFVSLENAKELISFAKLLKAEAATEALTSYYAENVFKIIDRM